MNRYTLTNRSNIALLLAEVPGDYLKELLFETREPLVLTLKVFLYCFEMILSAQLFERHLASTIPIRWYHRWFTVKEEPLEPSDHGLPIALG